MKTVYQIGDKVRTMCGTWGNPTWAYGRIAAIVGEENGNPQFRVVYDGEDGGYDYLYDFEIEPAR